MTQLALNIEMTVNNGNSNVTKGYRDMLKNIIYLIIMVLATTASLAEAVQLLKFKGDRLDSTPFKETSLDYYHKCSDVVHVSVRDQAFDYLVYLSEIHQIPKPIKSLCVIQEPKPGEWVLPGIYINYYVSNEEQHSCLYNNYCGNFRVMTLLNYKGILHGSILITNHDTKFMQMYCVNVETGKPIEAAACGTELLKK